MRLARPALALGLGVVFVAACASAPHRFVAVPGTHAQGATKEGQDDARLSNEGKPPTLSYCREVCGFAFQPGEEVVACQRAFISAKLEDRLHYPVSAMTICELR